MTWITTTKISNAFTCHRKRRECRSGAGFEKTKNACDTPGFKEQTEPSIENCRKTKKLCLKRNHTRITQTSTDMLRSWRGNCDIQMIIYDSNPDDIDLMEISRVTDYIVGYIGKGNSTMLEEKETNKQLILTAEEVTGNDQDLKALTKKIMNKAATRRLIPKQEACLLLAQMKLTSCSEMFSTVSLSRNHRISSQPNSNCNTFIAKYESRTGLDNMNLNDYFHYDRKQRRLPPAIPHFTGILGVPTFPVTEGYAKQTLLIYKPWRQFPNPNSWVLEFNRFINSSLCPSAPKLAYNRVMQRHYNGTKFVDPVSSRSNHDPNYETDEDEHAAILGGWNVSPENSKSLFDGIIKGENFAWDTQRKVILNIHGLHQYSGITFSASQIHFLFLWQIYKFFGQSRNLTSSMGPESWLEYEINAAKKDLEKKPHIPLKDNGKNYKIEDLHDDQKWIAYVVLAKLKEWFTSPDLSTFKPLRMTINGQAGTGKSVLINTLVSIVRSFTDCNNACLVAAPTGTAAFNVNGETIHSLSSISVSDDANVSPTASTKKRESLCDKLKDCIMLIFDERSLINTNLLGKAEQCFSQCAFGGLGANFTSSWGGVPVVIIAGDDYQLGGRGEIATDCSPGLGKPMKTNKNNMKGRELFLEFASTVYKLPKIRRVDKSKVDDANLMERLRFGEKVTDSDVSRLMGLQLNEIRNSHGQKVVDNILNNAIHLFFRNDKRIEHNLKQQAKINTKDNPTAIIKPVSKSRSRPRPVRAHFGSDAPAASIMAIGSQVSLKRNFFPLWGLHNGACGKVHEIVFGKDKNPNAGDLPEYVVVEFPLYRGPPWDLDNPKLVPVPMTSSNCKYHCCSRYFCPLQLCFARTIHTFQGLGAGPPEEGKTPHMYHCVVIDADDKNFERNHTGLLYTAVSRGTTLGDSLGLNSAVYFAENSLTRERVQQLTVCQNGEQEYIKVTKRRMWVKHLDTNTLPNQNPNTPDAMSVFRYFTEKLSYDDFHNIKMKYTS